MNNNKKITEKANKSASECGMRDEKKKKQKTGLEIMNVIFAFNERIVVDSNTKNEEKKFWFSKRARLIRIVILMY